MGAGSNSVHQSNGETPRSLQNSEDGEKGVICSLLLSPREIADQCRAKLRPDAFYLEANRIVYELALEFVDKGTPADFVILREELRDRGLLEEIGDKEYLDELFSFVPTAANAVYYIEIVREKHFLRQIFQTCREVSDKCDDRGAKAGELLLGLEQKLGELTKGIGSDDQDETFTVDELLSFDRDHDETCVFGNRWLCKGDSLLISGPTGIGKSSFVMLAAVRWMLGKDLFGIKTHKPQHVMLIQAENNKGDLAVAFQDACDQLKLSNAQIEEIKARFTLIRQCVRTGLEFVSWLRGKVKKHKPDIVIIDPLLSYVGGDISRQEVMSPFLRNGLQPILNETGIILVVIHHNGKPPRETKGKPPEGMKAYLALGSSELQNWPREILTFTVRDLKNRIFDVEFGKRAYQANLATPDGGRAFEWTLKHSKQGIVWEDCSAEEIAESEPESKKGGRGPEYSPDMITKCLKHGEEVSYAELQSRAAKRFSMSSATFERQVRKAKELGLVQKSKEGKWQTLA